MLHNSSSRSNARFATGVSFLEIKKNAKILEGLFGAPNSDEAFSTCVTAIDTAFNQLMAGGMFAQLGDAIHQKLDAIVTVMTLVVSLEQNSDLSPSKRQAIEGLQANAADKIVGALNAINANSSAWTKTKDIVIHQRLLMIENLLFQFTNCLKDNTSAKNGDGHLIKMPLEVNAEVLKHSKKLVQRRHNGTVSDSELNMNQILLQNRFLQNSTFKYHALKKMKNETYVHPDSGLELDFPLDNKVDIEYNGPLHYIAGIESAPTLDEIRKIQQLQELGYQRVVVNKQLVEKYGAGNRNHFLQVKQASLALASFLTMPGVIYFLDQNQQLDEIRAQIRSDIKDCKRNIEQQYDAIEFDVQHGRCRTQKERKISKEKRIQQRIARNPAMQFELEKLKKLLSLENKVRGFIKNNFIQKTLEQVDYSDIAAVEHNLSQVSQLERYIEQSYACLNEAQQRFEAIVSAMNYYQANNYKMAPDVYHQMLYDQSCWEQEIQRVKKELEYNQQLLQVSEQFDYEFFSNHLHLADLNCLLSDAQSEHARIQSCSDLNTLLTSTPPVLSFTGGSSSMAKQPSTEEKPDRYYTITTPRTVKITAG